MASRANSSLRKWEISLIKAMISKGMNDQTILSYFTRPERTVNHARISEIRSGTKHSTVKSASDQDLNNFYKIWPNVNIEDGTLYYGDELLIKSREAMIQAVQGYNNPKSYFKTENYIVLSNIAWTYLLHWHYKENNIDYKYYKDGIPLKTKIGAHKYWELSECISCVDCPLSEPVKANLKYLIEIRNEIEHQMTGRIDEVTGPKVQANSLNFNKYITTLAGAKYSLDSDLSMAIQFSSIDRSQRDILIKDMNIPEGIKSTLFAAEEDIPEEIIKDTGYAYRVAIVEKAVNSKGKADEVFEIVKAGSEGAEKVSRILLKESEKPKYKPGKIVAKMNAEGYTKFKIYNHTQLVNKLEAKSPSKGLGVMLNDNDWWWYEVWVERVRQHCEENKEIYT